MQSRGHLISKLHEIRSLTICYERDRYQQALFLLHFIAIVISVVLMQLNAMRLSVGLADVAESAVIVRLTHSKVLAKDSFLLTNSDITVSFFRALLIFLEYRTMPESLTSVIVTTVSLIWRL